MFHLAVGAGRTAEFLGRILATISVSRDALPIPIFCQRPPNSVCVRGVPPGPAKYRCVGFVDLRRAGCGSGPAPNMTGSIFTYSRNWGVRESYPYRPPDSATPRRAHPHVHLRGFVYIFRDANRRGTGSQCFGVEFGFPSPITLLPELFRIAHITRLAAEYTWAGLSHIFHDVLRSGRRRPNLLSWIFR